MKKFNDFFNDLFDFDHRLKPWQSIAITTATVLILVGAIVCLCVLDK